MRVYISCDMEGISGLVLVEETWKEGKDYDRFRKLMTAEVNAAALGAFDAGAKEVVINDSHGGMTNIMIEDLDPRVRLISGDMKPLSMVQGIEDGFDAAFFIGYHAGMGAKAGILDHTYYGAVVTEVKINGKILNEMGINALVAGHYKTPVALITGDERTCQEAKNLFGNVETVTVKWGITRYSARSIHPKEAQKMIRKGAKSALKNLSKFRQLTMDPPFTLNLRMLNSGMADNAEIMPGAVRKDSLTIEYRSNDLMTLFKGFLALLQLGAASIPKIKKK